MWPGTGSCCEEQLQGYGHGQGHGGRACLGAAINFGINHVLGQRYRVGSKAVRWRHGQWSQEGLSVEVTLIDIRLNHILGWSYKEGPQE